MVKLSPRRLLAYALYSTIGTFLPYRPKSLRRLRSRMVSWYAPKVDPSATINRLAKISPGATIEAHAGVGAGSVIPSDVTLRRHVMMGPNCLLLTGDHPVPEDGRFFGEYKSVRKPIIIGEDVFVGARVVILPGVTVGRGAAIGAGAVVAKDIPAGATVVGNPARIVKQRVPPAPIVENGYRTVDGPELGCCVAPGE